MSQVGDQLPQRLFADHVRAEPRHFALWPAPQALLVANISGQKAFSKILGGVVGHVEVRAELRVAGTIQAVTGEAVFLELGETGLYVSLGIVRRQ